MIVALYGDWGSGKTSTLNLCFEALREQSHEDQPLVVRFNPWWFSNTGDLLIQFFARLGEDLENVGKIEGIRKLAIRYGGMLAPAVGGAVDALGGSGLGSAAGGVFSRFANRSDQRAQERAQDVHALRAEITKLLEEFERRIVVVIDDIDRLSAQEMRDMFKVVKATADFPNTHYLLAFDFGTVSEALSSVQLTDGAAYLEKIVQVPFRLPDPTPGKIAEIVVEGLDEIVEDLNEILDRQKKLSPDEWSQAKEKLEYLGFFGLGTLWDNMRRANRFLDSLRFTLPSVAGEVRLCDFVLLEALRVTEPRVYERILDSQHLLVGTSENAQATLSLSGADKPQEEATRITIEATDAIVDASQRSELRPVIAEILGQLFPRVEMSKRGSGEYGNNFLDEWENQRRVCVPRLFRIATSWALPAGMISNAEVKELVSIRNPGLLRTRLRLYNDYERPGIDYAAALERIRPFYLSSDGEPFREVILRATLPEERADRGHPVAVLLALDTLRLLPETGLRRKLLVESIELHHVTPVIVDILRDLGKEHGWQGREEWPNQHKTLPDKQFRDVLEVALEDIRKQANPNVLLSRHMLDEYLYLWKDAAENNEPKEYLSRLLDENKVDLVYKLLRGLVGQKAADEIAAGCEPDDTSTIYSHLRVLQVFGVCERVKEHLQKFLAENQEQETERLFRWFLESVEKGVI